MTLFYHLTQDIAKKLVLLINEQNLSYKNLDCQYIKWKREIAKSSSMGSNSEILMKTSAAYKMKARMMGRKDFDYFYGVQIIKTSQVVLCSSLIQMARQTLSIAQRQSSPKDQPLGRSIGSQHLRDIVCHGRNHCMHYEDEKPHKDTLAFLKQLEQDFGNAFPYSKKPKESLAVELIAILGWTSHAVYARDMKSLLPTRAVQVTVKRTSRP